MEEGQKSKLRLEIAHVLFIDIVSYSKLLIDEQSEALQGLNQIVRNTEAARTAEAAGQLIILPTGDGMALVFTGSVEEPVECAPQISQALRAQPSLPVRMGIHSGPVHHVADVNQRENIAGAGINIAQRVMDCGDAGHILVSKRVADDLAQYRRWQPYLHELGDCQVKHGVVVSVVNLYADVVGNPEPPERFKHGKSARQRASASAQRKHWLRAGKTTTTAPTLLFSPAQLARSPIRAGNKVRVNAQLIGAASKLEKKLLLVLILLPRGDMGQKSGQKTPNAQLRTPNCHDLMIQRFNAAMRSVARGQLAGLLVTMSPARGTLSLCPSPNLTYYED